MILTNCDDDDKAVKALSAGASGYVLKSSPSAETCSAIREVADGGAPMRSLIARKVLDMFSRLTGLKGYYSLKERESEILKLMETALRLKEVPNKTSSSVI
jgi:DNA-binding NarL/FixJ family response regulator